ncbi:MAG: hypothetical protein JO094_14255 [Hyphomicrobiales bacterium]|nr:hypothetical protein [Hyphomicrobiales bacterium]
MLGYWQPSKAMRELGFSLVPCGPDGPDAWRKAADWNQRWQAYRRAKLSAGQSWPRESIGDAFDRYRATETFARKAPRTREDWERGWRRIRHVFGDCAPSTVTLEAIDAWYAAMLAVIGVREAHRAMKIWRALWVVMASLGFCDAQADPSKGVRRITPKSRSATWTEGQIVRLVKTAWRKGYHGLAVIIAISWDTGFSPIDARRLCGADLSPDGFRIPRAKTGKAAIGTISNRTRALMFAYLGDRKDEISSAKLFRNRRDAPYSKDTLGDDFRVVREAVFPGDSRKLMDVRRSVAKLANSIATNRELQVAYLPQNSAVVQLVDKARLVGRQAIRGTKV